MLIKNLEHSQGKQALLPLFLTLLFAMSFWPARAQGQIVGNLEANIPFQFVTWGKDNPVFPQGRLHTHP